MGLPAEVLAEVDPQVRRCQWWGLPRAMLIRPSLSFHHHPLLMLDPRPKRVQRKADAIGGGTIRFDIYDTPDCKTYLNYRITCLRCPKHKACGKSLEHGPEQCTKFGRIEPLAVLHAWRPMGLYDPRKTHARHWPADDLVAVFVASHRDELERLADELLSGR